MGQFSAPENEAEIAPIFGYVGIDFYTKGRREIFEAAKPRAQKMGLKRRRKWVRNLRLFWFPRA